MTDILILSLPKMAELANVTPCPAPYWAQIHDGGIIARGSGDGWRDIGAAQDGMDMRIIALAPAADAPVQYHRYADAPPAQASTAARLDVQKRLLGGAANAHVTAALPAEIGQDFPVAITSAAAMAAWTAWLKDQGICVDAILPAAALLPAHAEGGVVGAEVAGEHVMRCGDHCYASDPAIDALFRHDSDVMWLNAEERDIMLLVAAAHPVMDLRSGAWAVKYGLSWDSGIMRWIKRLAAALILLSLLIFAVQAARLMNERARADLAVMDVGHSLKIDAVDPAGVEAMIDQRLGQSVGGPLAFSVPASALYSLLADAPAVSLKSLSHRGDGTLSASLAAPRVDDLNPVLIALQAKGYRITAQPMAGRDGQQMANITIRAVP